ncbi:hypothetical protein FA13DRAFT_1797279 [Coprinellus micaceus]|uniref:Uncharacterized protein n=1 Tax=Coprinellus micaceus TaxID=71717 RepID=A0A4Y7ST24_COPMI|nr:hypothetical protein FA13DRAFT_1797279 [Coprinellus micaceus]
MTSSEGTIKEEASARAGTARPSPSARNSPVRYISLSVKPPSMPLPQPGHSAAIYKPQRLSSLQSTVTPTIFCIHIPPPSNYGASEINGFRLKASRLIGEEPPESSIAMASNRRREHLRPGDLPA